jgi:hypothetical protein
MTTLQQSVLECRQTREATARMLEWLEDQHEVEAGSRTVLQHDLDRALHEVATISRAAERSSGIGVLAPQTPTIIRLVNTLVGGNESKVHGQFLGSHTHLPILAGLLPAADLLGAATVIRLTHEDPAQAAAKSADTVGRLMADDVPRKGSESSIRLQIFSLAEVIMVLGRAYLANVKPEPVFSNTGAVMAALSRALQEDVSVATQPGLAAHQVQEIRAYLESRFVDHPALDALGAAGYWEVFATLAPRASPEGRRRLASLIWNGFADFETAYGELAHAIAGLNYNTEIVAPADSVRADDTAHGWGVAHPRTILAAATLLDPTGSDSEPSVDRTVIVRSRFGQPVTIDRSVLSALVSEVALYVEGDQQAVLAGADIIYLPTACPAVEPRMSRVGVLLPASLTGPREKPWLARALLQAKTLFLAERAVANLDLSGLIVGVDPQAPLPAAFAPIVSHWVGLTQGRAPAEREANDTTLFVAVGAAEATAGPTDAATSWGALGAFLADFSDGQDWLERWGTDQAFDNVFILGSGNGARRQAEASAPQPSTANLPVPVRQTAAGMIASYGGSELRDGGLWLRHVRNTAVALDEALNTADGGIRYLAQSVGAVSYPRAKRRQITNRLSEIRRGITETTRRFCYASSPTEDADWRHRAALATQARLRQCASHQRLGPLIQALSVGERDFSSLFERVVAEQMRRGTDDDQRILDFQQQWAGVDGVEGDLAARLAKRFAQLATEHWFGNMRAFSATPGSVQPFNFTEVTFPHLIDEIIVGAVRQELMGRLAVNVARTLTSSSGSISLQAARAGRLASEMVSGFLSQLGFDSPWSARHPKRRGTLGAPLFERSVASGPEAIASVAASRVTLQYCSDWCEAFTVMADENIAAARGMRSEEGSLRELEELLDAIRA